MQGAFAQSNKLVKSFKLGAVGCCIKKLTNPHYC